MLTSSTWYETEFLERSDYKYSRNTPNYWALVSSGQDLPDNEYYRYGEWKFIDYLEGERWIRGQYGYYPFDRYQFYFYPSGFQLPTFSWDGPNQDFLEKVKTDSIGIMTMLAERTKTADLLKEFMGNVLYTVIHWKKPVKVFRRWLKDDAAVRKWATKRLHRRIARCTTPAEAWLEYRYAYRPLFADVRDALGAFKQSTRKQHLFRVTTKGERSGNTTAEYLGPIGSVTGHCASTNKFRIGGRFRVVDPSLAALGNLASFAAGVWDIIPLSFVVDWAFDISSYLDLQNATLGLEFISGFRSEKNTHNRTYTQNTLYFGGTYYVASTPCRASWRSEYFERTKMTSCPTPTIMVGKAAEIFSTTHIADILALIRSIKMKTYRSTYHFTD